MPVQSANLLKALYPLLPSRESVAYRQKHDYLSRPWSWSRKLQITWEPVGRLLISLARTWHPTDPIPGFATPSGRPIALSVLKSHKLGLLSLERVECQAGEWNDPTSRGRCGKFNAGTLLMIYAGIAQVPSGPCHTLKDPSSVILTMPIFNIHVWRWIWKVPGFFVLSWQPGGRGLLYGVVTPK